MKRTCKIMMKSVFKMIRMSRKCPKNSLEITCRVTAGFDVGFRVVSGCSGSDKKSDPALLIAGYDDDD